MDAFLPPSLQADVARMAEREQQIKNTLKDQDPYVKLQEQNIQKSSTTTNTMSATVRSLSTRSKAFASDKSSEIPPFQSQAEISPVLPTSPVNNISMPMNSKGPVIQAPTRTRNLSVNAVAQRSSVKDNGFSHQAMAKKLAHLTHTDPPAVRKLSFVYENTNEVGKTLDNKGEENLSDPLNQKELALVAPVVKEGDSNDQFPSLKPTTRKEVALLKQTMIALLKDIGCDLDQDYPTEMHAFLAIIREEQKIYDTVFQELIRQSSIQMLERGEILAEVRKRYGAMFMKIPGHVKHLHVELVAQRKLNRRLAEELSRAKDTIAELSSELEMIRKHDSDVTIQAQEAQEKLVSVLTQSDNTDEILEEYHKLYRMQRDRLEEAVRIAERDKKMWVESATSLALRIGAEHGIGELQLLQRAEQSRLRASNHMIVIISNTNEAEMTSIERKIEEWRTRILRLSHTVVEEDTNNIETLSKMQRDMKMVIKNLVTNEPKDQIEAEHPLLKVFHVYDVKSLADHLKKWVDQMNSVAIRFTSDRDLALQEELIYLKKNAEAWVEAGMKLLRRNEKNANGKDYIPLLEALSKVAAEIDDWVGKLETRVSGEDGLASNVISLQNQLEDRYTAYSGRDFDKPLAPTERLIIKDALSHWYENINVLIRTLSNTSQKEQYQTPLHVDNWTSQLLEQLTMDTDLRNEENIKLHTSMISWMVNLLVKGGKEKPNESWDHEFLQLHQELIGFNLNMMRDAADIEMVADDKKDLRFIVQ